MGIAVTISTMLLRGPRSFGTRSSPMTSRSIRLRCRSTWTKAAMTATSAIPARIRIGNNGSCAASKGLTINKRTPQM